MNVGDQVLLVLLQRVHDGCVTEFCGGQYFDDGERIHYWNAERALAEMVEMGRIELTYPPGSGALRAAEYGPGELVYGVHFGLSVAERTRRASLTERGLAEYKALRAQSAGPWG